MPAVSPARKRNLPSKTKALDLAGLFTIARRLRRASSPPLVVSGTIHHREAAPAGIKQPAARGNSVSLLVLFHRHILIDRNVFAAGALLDSKNGFFDLRFIASEVLSLNFPEHIF